MLGQYLTKIINIILQSDRTTSMVLHDLRRLSARVRNQKQNLIPDKHFLHIGCGRRFVPG